ncbi:hypothetical protein [Segetibacter koreensis]|uniref:hypothetical protein n=1 Tax=Segetibacter koreensis TaxID=398037 RepID=UPI00146B70BF|nr:hypothetical protein [Segetibacter koreensis]
MGQAFPDMLTELEELVYMGIQLNSMASLLLPTSHQVMLVILMEVYIPQLCTRAPIVSSNRI